MPIRWTPDGAGPRTNVTLDRGTVVLVDLDPTNGREQRGLRPCVIVIAPEVTDNQHFPLVCVIPVTREDARPGGAYPALSPAQRAASGRSSGLLTSIHESSSCVACSGDSDLEAINTGLCLSLGIDRGIEA